MLRTILPSGTARMDSNSEFKANPSGRLFVFENSNQFIDTSIYRCIDKYMVCDFFVHTVRLGLIVCCTKLNVALFFYFYYTDAVVLFKPRKQEETAMARYFLLKTISSSASSNEGRAREHVDLVLKKHGETISSLEAIAGVEKTTGCGSRWKDKRHMAGFEIICHRATLEEYDRLEEKLKALGFDVWLIEADGVMHAWNMHLRLMEEIRQHPEGDPDGENTGNDG